MEIITRLNRGNHQIIIKQYKINLGVYCYFQIYLNYHLQYQEFYYTSDFLSSSNLDKHFNSLLNLIDFYLSLF